MFQLKIENCKSNEAEALSDFLEEMGALSVTLTLPYASSLDQSNEDEIHVIYAEEEAVQSVREFLAQEHPHLKVTLEVVPKKDWERICIADLKPQQFGARLWVCPPGETPSESDAVYVEIDPGLAFGSGTHPTTALCLTWLEKANLFDKQIIDYGCGSGVLGIAALKLGASHVYAVDLDEQALKATRDNAHINQTTLSSLSISSPEALIKPVDLIVANILLRPLLELQPIFHQLLKPGGMLILSGILNEQVAQLIASYQDTFLHQATFSQDDWVLVELIQKI